MLKALDDRPLQLRTYTPAEIWSKTMNVSNQKVVHHWFFACSFRGLRKSATRSLNTEASLETPLLKANNTSPKPLCYILFIVRVSRPQIAIIRCRFLWCAHCGELFSFCRWYGRCSFHATKLKRIFRTGFVCVGVFFSGPIDSIFYIKIMLCS